MSLKKKVNCLSSKEIKNVTELVEAQSAVIKEIEVEINNLANASAEIEEHSTEQIDIIENAGFILKDPHCQVNCNDFFQNTSNGVSQPKHFLGIKLILIITSSTTLFVNDEKVETDEDLTYSIAYQNTLLPVIQEGVQTGYDNNMPIYIIISGISLSGVIAIALSLRKKKRK